MSGSKKADSREILLHDIYTILSPVQHLDYLFNRAFGFFKIRNNPIAFICHTYPLGYHTKQVSVTMNKPRAILWRGAYAPSDSGVQIGKERLQVDSVGLSNRPYFQKLKLVPEHRTADARNAVLQKNFYLSFYGHYVCQF